MPSIESNSTIVIPVREESLKVSKERIHSGGVRVDITVDQRVISLDAESEAVEVERVPSAGHWTRQRPHEWTGTFSWCPSMRRSS